MSTLIITNTPFWGICNNLIVGFQRDNIPLEGVKGDSLPLSMSEKSKSAMQIISDIFGIMLS